MGHSDLKDIKKAYVNKDINTVLIELKKRKDNIQRIWEIINTINTNTREIHQTLEQMELFISQRSPSGQELDEEKDPFIGSIKNLIKKFEEIYEISEDLSLHAKLCK